MVWISVDSTIGVTCFQNVQWATPGDQVTLKSRSGEEILHWTNINSTVNQGEFFTSNQNISSLCLWNNIFVAFLMGWNTMMWGNVSSFSHSCPPLKVHSSTMMLYVGTFRACPDQFHIDMLTVACDRVDETCPELQLKMDTVSLEAHTRNWVSGFEGSIEYEVSETPLFLMRNPFESTEFRTDFWTKQSGCLGMVNLIWVTTPGDQGSSKFNVTSISQWSSEGAFWGSGQLQNMWLQESKASCEFKCWIMKSCTLKTETVLHTNWDSNIPFQVNLSLADLDRCLGHLPPLSYVHFWIKVEPEPVFENFILTLDVLGHYIPRTLTVHHWHLYYTVMSKSLLRKFNVSTEDNSKYGFRLILPCLLFSACAVVPLKVPDSGISVGTGGPLSPYCESTFPLQQNRFLRFVHFNAEGKWWLRWSSVYCVSYWARIVGEGGSWKEKMFPKETLFLWATQNFISPKSFQISTNVTRTTKLTWPQKNS